MTSDQRSLKWIHRIDATEPYNLGRLSDATRLLLDTVYTSDPLKKRKLVYRALRIIRSHNRNVVSDCRVFVTKYALACEHERVRRAMDAERIASAA